MATEVKQLDRALWIGVLVAVVWGATAFLTGSFAAAGWTSACMIIVMGIHFKRLDAAAGK
jgi:O-antigen ligase